MVGEIVSNNIIPLYPFTISFTPHNHHYFSPSKQINNAPKSSFPGHIYIIYIYIITIVTIIISIYESSFVFFSILSENHVIFMTSMFHQKSRSEATEVDFGSSTDVPPVRCRFGRSPKNARRNDWFNGG